MCVLAKTLTARFAAASVWPWCSGTDPGFSRHSCSRSLALHRPRSQARPARPHLPGPGQRATAGSSPDHTTECLPRRGGAAAAPLVVSRCPLHCRASPAPVCPSDSFTLPGLAQILFLRVRAVLPLSLCWPVVSVALTSAGVPRLESCVHSPHPDRLVPGCLRAGVGNTSGEQPP